LVQETSRQSRRRHADVETGHGEAYSGVDGAVRCVALFSDRSALAVEVDAEVEDFR